MKRLAIVTGASSGIGFATARALGNAGCDLVLAARREAPMRALASELVGVEVNVIVTDLSEPQQCARLIANARDTGPESYPILVNAAGAAHFEPFAENSVEQVLEQLKVNLRGPTLLCHAVLPWMLQVGGGQIINLLSVTVQSTFAGSGAYSAAKSGLYMLGKVIAADYRHHGVRVTSVIPGAVDTQLWNKQRFVPERGDMLSPSAVAEAILGLVEMPLDRNVDELTLMPPKGVLKT